MRYTIDTIDGNNYSCTDTSTGLRATWSKGMFNETQTFYHSNVIGYNADGIAHLCTEMSDWLSVYHYNLVMPEQRQDAVIIHQLKTIRMMKGISQVDLANFCHMTQSGIARMEKGIIQPNLSTLVKIAEALGCELTIKEAE